MLICIDLNIITSANVDTPVYSVGGGGDNKRWLWLFTFIKETISGYQDINDQIDFSYL